MQLWELEQRVTALQLEAASPDLVVRFRGAAIRPYCCWVLASLSQ